MIIIVNHTFNLQDCNEIIRYCRTDTSGKLGRGFKFQITSFSEGMAVYTSLTWEW